MKKILTVLTALSIATVGFTQVKDGRILFERTTQLRMQIANTDQNFQNMIPKERKDRFELLFTEGKSLWQVVVDNTQDNEMSFSSSEGANIQIRMPGSDDIVFHNIADMKKVDQRELGGKTYIISDSVNKLSWKVAGETKTILGYPCMKATAQRTQQNMRMNMDNGKMTRETVTDTLNIVAWFTNEIHGSFGPESYQGQLPGTILEIDVSDGRTKYVAIEISPKTDVAKIKEPGKGKKVTSAEFAKEREKLFADMQQNGGGNMRIIRN